MKRLILALLFVLALGSNAHALSVVSHSCSSAVGGGDGTDFTTSTLDTNGANLIIVFTAAYIGSTGLTLSDSKGNTWTGLTNVASSLNSRLWYAFSATAGASHTFTISASGNLFDEVVCVIAVSGALSSDPIDQQSTNSNSSSTTIATGSITPTQAGELIVTGVASGADNTPPSVNSGFTLADTATGSGHDLVGLAYLIQGAASAVNPTWTLNAAANNQAAIASFKAPSTTGSARRRPIVLQ